MEYYFLKQYLISFTQQKTKILKLLYIAPYPYNYMNLNVVSQTYWHIKMFQYQINDWSLGTRIQDYKTEDG